METAENKGVLKSVTLAELYEMARRKPKTTFDDWPILEIRQKYLKAMEGWLFYKDLADWAEKQIWELFSLEVEVPEAMLERYMFNAQDTARAIEFSLSLVLGKSICPFHKVSGFVSIENTVSKIVAGRLLKNEVVVLYHKLPSLPKFLEELLGKLDRPYRTNDSSYEYSGSDWVCAERALRIIIEYKDFSFLPKIEELISKKCNF